ncbi:unnamed protein product [Prorocentrum cordatum]|uniref:EF-hand domain-containing protein n=1 Tax=Prorocentrum cordatum TaxID=2364126 RepID=A0ABN9WVT1_9DINO|nr:unnamed protein product [Polarella glacialis]
MADSRTSSLVSDVFEQVRRRSSQTPSQQDIAAERVWWSEALLGALQKMLAEQTKQLQACVAEEAQKQHAMIAQVPRLLAEHTRQLRGCVQEEVQKQTRELQVPLAALASGGGSAPTPGGQQDHEDAPRGRLEELLEREAEERRVREAGLREMVQQQGGALARIEALFEPPGEASASWSPPELDTAVEGDYHPPVIHASTFGMGVVTSPRKANQGRSCRAICTKVCSSRGFVVCTACVILANSVYLGFEANEIMISPSCSLPESISWRIANGFFALAFLAELSVRFIADGTDFLVARHRDVLWNWFDTLLILITVVEEFLRYFSVDVITFGFLRLTRLLRVTRIMRAFRVVRDFKELKIMITGLLNCARPLFWAGVLLLLLTYMMGILLAQLLSEYLRSVKDEELDEENLKAVNYVAKNFSNLGESMYSLFEALTGGRDWGDIAGPFRHIHWILVCCLIMYIVVGVFCILNLLTAVFLEAAHRIDDVQELVYKKRDWVAETSEFFLAAIKNIPHTPHTSSFLASSDEHPRITEDAFIKLLSTQTNVKFLEENGVDLFFRGHNGLSELFHIMDEDGNGTLDVNEFVVCLYNLKGTATSLDLKLENQKLSRLVRSLHEQLQSMQPITPSSSSPRLRTCTSSRARTISGPGGVVRDPSSKNSEQAYTPRQYI